MPNHHPYREECPFCAADYPKPESDWRRVDSRTAMLWLLSVVSVALLGLYVSAAFPGMVP